MVRVGILGSVGSGKTFIANIFKELSFNIFSADNEVANIYKNDKVVNRKIAKFFKLKLYNGKINKQDLRDLLKKELDLVLTRIKISIKLSILFSTKSGISKTTNLFFLNLDKKRANLFLTIG